MGLLMGLGLEQYKGMASQLEGMLCSLGTRLDLLRALSFFLLDLLLQPYLLVMYLGWFGLFRNPCR